MAKSKVAGTSGVGIEIQGIKQLSRALRALGETDAPFLREALDRSGRQLAGAIRRHADGGIADAVEFRGVKGGASALRAALRIKHPGSRSMEFGRVWYYRGYSGRAVKETGSRFRARGQKAKPFIGIVRGDAAIGEVGDEIQADLAQAFEDEWERIGAEPD